MVPCKFATGLFYRALLTYTGLFYKSLSQIYVLFVCVAALQEAKTPVLGNFSIWPLLQGSFDIHMSLSKRSLSAWQDGIFARSLPISL